MTQQSHNKAVPDKSTPGPAPSRAPGGFFAGLPPWALPAAILAVVAVLGVGIAIGMAIAPNGSAEESASSTTTSVPDTMAYGGAITVVGEALPQYRQGETDSAVGRAMPQVTGTDFAGNTLTISNDGVPKLIVALAHWCPYCNAEAPILMDWYAAGSAAGVEVISLHVFTNPEKDNFPPATWVADLGWNLPLIADDAASTLVTTLGIRAVPYWLLVSADGTVVQRGTGQLEAEALDSIVAGLLAGAAGS